VAAGVLLSVLLPLWRTAGVGRTTQGPTLATAVPRELPVAGLEPTLWVAILERDGLEAARQRLEALRPATDGAASIGSAALLIREGRRQVRQGRVRTAVALGLLAIQVDPTDPDAYAALEDACIATGDGACAARARRAMTLVVGRGAR
jgi:hypothetical protein